jgi:hypothetical protein
MHLTNMALQKFHPDFDTLKDEATWSWMKMEVFFDKKINIS